jgi:hypothetical protein
MLSATEFENLVSEGVHGTYTTWQGEEVESTYEGSEFWHEADGSTQITLDDTHKATYVDGETGGEGSGEYIWQVWSVTDAEGNEQFFRKTGYYMSYEGSTWDGDLTEVVPFEKTVTDWKSKK